MYLFSGNLNFQGVMRILRRVSGYYVPHLQPYWSGNDIARVKDWLANPSDHGGKERMIQIVQDSFPMSAEIVLADSGKSALYAALQLLDLKNNAEVLVPSYCCASVIASIIHAGATPVLVDSDQNLNISYESVLSALSPRVGAILVPHLFGLKAEGLDLIIAAAHDKGVTVIEDVSQAYGLRYTDGQLAGSRGDAAIFSSGLGKPIMGPGGGWTVLNKVCDIKVHLPEESLSETKSRVESFMRRFTGPYSRRGIAEVAYAIRSRLRSWAERNPDLDLQAWAKAECRGYDISEIEAYISVGQMERIQENIQLRRANAMRWKRLLDMHGIPCKTMPDTLNIFTAFPLLFNSTSASSYSKRFRAALEANGVSTQPGYTPLHLRPCGKALRRTDMHVVETLWKGVFTVPVRPNLTNLDWAYISRAVQVSAEVSAYEI